MKEGVTVCITAYKAQKYIKECLDSVISQTWFKTHDNWEIIVGVDGCQDTLDYLKTIMNNYKNLRVFMMDSNKGTYITSNTIMSNATYENIFRFDSDDIMCSNLVDTVLSKKGNCSLVRYYFKNFGANTKIKKAHGTIYIKKSVFVKYGGFRPWVCGADTEIFCRLKNVENVKQLPDILMLRRIHNESLTQKNGTGMHSELRKKYSKLIDEMHIEKESDAIIKCEQNTYKEIFSEMPDSVDKNMYIKNVKTYSIKNDENDNATNKTNNSIKKLRRDIESGRVIRVPVVGGFVWKRVK